MSDKISNQSLVSNALDILKQLGLSNKQQNTRSALTLLALLNLKPGDTWKDATNPLCGITPMMDFFAKHYGKKYAPNSRETVRRQTIHQFLQAGIIVANPDKPNRPVNSGNTVYQIKPEILKLLKSYGKTSWEVYLNMGGSRVIKNTSSNIGKPSYYQSRDNAIVIQFASKTINLSVGKHNELVKSICTEFASKFLKKKIPVYIGDTARKFAYFDEELLHSFGISIDPHGKIPDVIIYDSRPYAQLIIFICILNYTIKNLKLNTQND